MFDDRHPSPPPRDRSHHPKINLREGALRADAAAEAQKFSLEHWPTPIERVVPSSIARLIDGVMRSD